jgi:hypothetical protein
MVVFSAFYQLLRSLLLPRLVLGAGKSGSAPATGSPAPFVQSTSASSPRSLVLAQLSLVQAIYLRSLPTVR